jgi:outer membrane protein TolC
MRPLNLTWIVFFCSAFLVQAQPVTELVSTNKAPVPLSLDDCLRRAIVQNIGLQLSRAQPEVSRYLLSGAYGYYDPNFSSRAASSYAEDPGGFNAVINDTVPGARRTRNDFSVGFDGVLPTGTRYFLDGNISKTFGDRFFVFTNPTNNVTSIIEGNIPLQYQSTVAAGITQPLLRNLWIDQGRSNIKLLKKELKQSELGLEYNIMQTMNQVSQAYYDLIAARDQITVQAKAVELAEQLVREMRRKVEVGTEAPLSEKQAQSQAATARSDLIRARFDAEVAENTLKRLITGNFISLDETRLEPTEKLLAVYRAVNERESWENGLRFRPDYLQTKIDIERAQIQLEYRFNQVFPQLDVTLTYGRNGLAPNLGDSLEQIGENRFYNYGGAVVLNFPLTFRTDRNNYKIAKVNKQTAILQLKSLEENIVSDIDNAVKAIRSAYAATVSSHEARIYAEAALDAEQKKLENGKSTSFEVLRLQRDLTNASAQEINALAAYNKALYLLYFREGTILQRAKINLDFK